MLVVGLIEACKGMAELYQPLTTSLSNGQGQDGQDEKDEDEDEDEDEGRIEEFKQAFESLTEMTFDVMSVYTKTLLFAFRTYFQRYGALFFAALRYEV